MKFTIKKSDILDVLSKVQGITGRKSNLAITETVLINAGGSEITITATDLESGFEGRYSADIESEGTIAINSRKLFEIIKNYPTETILINEVENRWIEIGSGKVQYHIVGMNPDDFPENPYVDEAPFFEIDSEILRNMIEKTVIVIGSSEDKRAHIIGNYFDVLENEEGRIVRMVSTDGSRLSAADCTLGKDVPIPVTGGVIVSKKGLNEISKFLDSETVVKIGILENSFIMKKDAETVIIRLLEGEFPEYEDIIAKREGHEIELNKQMFSMMLKRMSILTSDSYKGTVFRFADNKLVITATNPDIGESKEDIDIEFEGEPIEVAFNPKFFIETMSVIESEMVILTLVDATNPCMIEGEGDSNYKSVIMPMKV